MIKSVKKRDGRIVEYYISKIETAITRAMLSLGYGEIKDIKRMAKIVELYLNEKFESTIPTVEDVQDLVESVLMKNGYEDVAKAYILYRRDTKNFVKLKTHFLTTKTQLTNT